MTTAARRLEAVARILYSGLPSTGGAAFGHVMLDAAGRLESYAIDDTAGDARVALELRELFDRVCKWRDQLIAAVCDGPPIECQCCKRPIPNCAKCSEPAIRTGARCLRCGAGAEWIQ